MDVTVEGLGTFNLQLVNGNLEIRLQGNLVTKTKGNPILGNPPFESIDQCLSWFNSQGEFQPVVEETA